jgi:hypothetical protein
MQLKFKYFGMLIEKSSKIGRAAAMRLGSPEKIPPAFSSYHAKYLDESRRYVCKSA